MQNNDKVRQLLSNVVHPVIGFEMKIVTYFFTWCEFLFVT